MLSFLSSKCIERQFGNSLKYEKNIDIIITVEPQLSEPVETRGGPYV